MPSRSPVQGFSIDATAMSVGAGSGAVAWAGSDGFVASAGAGAVVGCGDGDGWDAAAGGDPPAGGVALFCCSFPPHASVIPVTITTTAACRRHGPICVLLPALTSDNADPVQPPLDYGLFFHLATDSGLPLSSCVVRVRTLDWTSQCRGRFSESGPPVLCPGTT